MIHLGSILQFDEAVGYGYFIRLFVIVGLNGIASLNTNHIDVISLSFYDVRCLVRSC